MASSVVHNVKKIVLLRANGLGDLIVTLPAIKAIRKTYPDAELVLLAKPWHKNFLEKGRTPIDRVEVIPVIKNIREEVELKENKNEIEIFFKKMQKEQFDIAVHFQGKGVASSSFLNKLNARVTVGLSCSEAEPINRTLSYYYYQSEIIRFLEVAKLIGAKELELEPEIEIFEKDKKEVSKFLELHQVKKPFIVFHATAKDQRRVWPGEKFAELANILSKKGYTIIFSGTKEEEESINKIRAEINYPTINSSSEISLGGLAYLMQVSDLVISNDTGPLHLAQAVKAKTVGIYWAPNLINWGPLVRDKNRPVISWSLKCPVCGIIPNNPYPFEPHLTACKHEISFVKDVSVVEVLQEVNNLLENDKSAIEKSLNEMAL